MTTIVTDNCHGCRYTDCVTVCPVECFHFDDDMLYIDPEVCIDCSACIPECPVQAIFEEDDLPEDKQEWIDAVQPLYSKYGEGYEDLISSIHAID